MTEQPFYKLCQFCGHYNQTVKSKDKFVCTRFPQHIDRDPDDFCGEWACARCWCSWDMVIQEDGEESTGIYMIDHTRCPEVKLDPNKVTIVEVPT
jgi:hypothetical protein